MPSVSSALYEAVTGDEMTSLYPVSPDQGC
jgi:hypothetical protein